MNERRAWIALLVGALVLVVAAALLVVRGRGGARTAGVETARRDVPDAGCAPVALRLRPGEADAPAAPVLLVASGEVRLLIDGKPVSAGAPLRLTANMEHTLRVEAGREEPLLTRFKLEPHAPALLHAQVDDGLGITLVRLGLFCTSCEFPVSEVELDQEASSESSFALLRAAAASLRTDKWQSALERLRHVPRKARESATFLRLASSVYQAGGRPERAEKLARSIPAARARELAGALEAWTQLRGTEKERLAAAQLERWNTLTERFGQLAARFQQAAPGQVAAAAKRLESLGTEFERAVEAKELRGQQAALAAAEQSVLQAAEEIRSTRPGDCAFQQDLVATLNP